MTSSKVGFPSYVGRFDDMTEKPRLSDSPGIGRENPQNPDGPEVGSEIWGTGVICTSVSQKLLNDTFEHS